jgi:hypothetical protein
MLQLPQQQQWCQHLQWRQIPAAAAAAAVAAATTAASASPVRLGHPTAHSAKSRCYPDLAPQLVLQQLLLLKLLCPKLAYCCCCALPGPCCCKRQL